jgi:HlyD family secretion protein
MTRLSNLLQTLRRRLSATDRSGRAWLAVAVLAVSVLVSVSIFATGPRPLPDVVPEKIWPVSVATVTPESLAPTFAAYGRVESVQVAHLQSNLDAEVARVNVREGQWVAKDAVLVELVRDEFELRVRQRQAELDEQRAALQSLRAEQRTAQQTDAQYRAMHDVAQKRRERYEDLFARKMIAQSLLDETVAQTSQATIDYANHVRALADFPNRIGEQAARVERSQAALAQACFDLDRTIIRAPFAGPVLAVTAAPGNHTTLATPLIDMADADGFEVRAPLPDDYGARVRDALATGRTISARIGDDPTPLLLTRVSSRVRKDQSGLDAFFKLVPQGDRALPEIGRVVDLIVTLPQEPAVVALPVQSIYDNNRIYEVADDDRLHALPIKRVGEHRTADGGYRVLVRADALRPGSRIITTQLPKAADGVRVQPVGEAVDQPVTDSPDKAPDAPRRDNA